MAKFINLVQDCLGSLSSVCPKIILKAVYGKKKMQLTVLAEFIVKDVVATEIFSNNLSWSGDVICKYKRRENRKSQIVKVNYY